MRFPVRFPFFSKKSQIRSAVSNSGATWKKTPLLTDRGRTLDRALIKKACGRYNLPSATQLAHIGSVLTKRDKVILWTASALLTLSVLMIGLLTYSDHTIVVSADGGFYREALVGTPRFINPLLAPLNDVDADLARLIYSGLFRRDGSGRLAPDLALSYEINPENTAYTIHLNSNVVWHDDKPFSADDVVYTYRAVTDREIKSPLASAYAGLQVQKINDSTVVFTLDRPFAPFLDSLTLGILPAHIWQDISSNAFPYADYNVKRPIGTGPYQVKRLTFDKRGQILSYTLIRNKRLEPSAAHLEEIEFFFFANTDDALSALSTREVDGVGFIPPENAVSIDQKTTPLLALDLPEYRAIFFNVISSSVVSDRSVRQALAYATNKQAIIRETASGYATIATGPILPGLLGYNPLGTKYAEDLTESAKILDSAGWKLSAGASIRTKTVTVKEGKKTTETELPLALTITVIDKPSFVKTAELLKAQWSRVGAEISIRVVAGEVMQKDVLRGRSFEVLIYNEILGADPDPFIFWHSSGADESGLNLSGYANREVDALLSEARKTIDPEKRAMLYRDFQIPLMNDLPVIFLMSPKYLYAISSKILGIDTVRLSVPSDRFTNITNWYVKTKKAWK